MYRSWFSLFLNILYVIDVNSMVLYGPVVTTYNPCGVGAILFAKNDTDTFWKGSLNFGLYQTLVHLEMSIDFETPVFITEESNQTQFDTFVSTTKLTVKERSPVSDGGLYNFYITVTNNASVIPIVSKFVLNGKTICSQEIKDTQAVQFYNASLELSSTSYCGRRHMQHTELYSTETDAKAGDWPWHVAVIVKDTDTDWNYQCGGSIISRFAVITAASCIYFNNSLLEPPRLRVVAGASNYLNLTQPGRQLLNATDLLINPDYIPGEYAANLAIIKINRFDFNKYVQPVCISNIKTDLVGMKLIINGFGYTDRENKGLQNIQRVSFTPVQKDTLCDVYFNDTGKLLNTKGIICAGWKFDNGTRMLSSDIGGGLILQAVYPDHMLSWVLQGVMIKTFSDETDSPSDSNYNTLYTDVRPHYEWIRDNSGSNID